MADKKTEAQVSNAKVSERAVEGKVLSEAVDGALAQAVREDIPIRDRTAIDRNYANTYADQINAQLNDYNGRNYQYDPSTDNLYQNFKKEYMTEAQKARNNVVNEGYRLSGGYGNDFSQSVSDQQYERYLTDINRLAPAFENLAYAQYQGENDDILNRLKLLLGREEGDYERNRYEIKDQEAYRDYLNDVNQFNMNLELNLDKIAKSKDDADKDYELKAYKDTLNSFIAQKEAEAKAKSGGGRSGGSGGGSSYYGGGDTYDYSADSDAADAARAAIEQGVNNLMNSSNRTVAHQNIGGVDYYTRGTRINGFAVPTDPLILANYLTGTDTNVYTYQGKPSQTTVTKQKSGGGGFTWQTK